MKNKKLKILSCSVFTLLYLIVSIISLICSTSFFNLAHSGIMSWVLAIGFELGAMSCLLSTLILPKKKLGLVWFMFVVLTLFQCMGNMYAAFINLENYTDWIDMFGMNEMEPLGQKRVLAAISGIILPLVALGFIRIMANILQDGKTIEINDYDEEPETPSMFGNTEPKKYESEIEDVKNDDDAKAETPQKAVPIEPKKETIEPKNEPKETSEKKEAVKPVEKKEAVKLVEDKNETLNTNQKPQTDVKKIGGRVWNNELNAEVG